MYISQRTPWPRAAHLHNDLHSFVERCFRDDDSDRSKVASSQWTPRVDIRENKEGFVIFADIPGVDPDNIEIHMDKGMLTIRGERDTDSQQEADSYSRVERAHGTFYRRFALPDSADAEGIKANGKHGVLEVRIPKKAESKPRRIPIDAAA